MKLFFHDFLIALVATLLLGGMILLIALGLSAKPMPMDAQKPATWSVERVARAPLRDKEGLGFGLVLWQLRFPFGL